MGNAAEGLGFGGEAADPSIAKCSPCNGHAARSDFGAFLEECLILSERGKKHCWNCAWGFG